jgi:hypothetical protein
LTTQESRIHSKEHLPSMNIGVLGQESASSGVRYHS